MTATGSQEPNRPGSAISVAFSPPQRFTGAELQGIAERIRDRIRSCSTDTIAIGEDLLLVKKRLDHGEFGFWLKTEFGWTQRTAQRCMQAAVAFGGKATLVSYLPVTTIYSLSAPSATVARGKVIERIEKGERVPVKEIDAICHEVGGQHNEARAKAKATAERKARPANIAVARENYALELAELDAAGCGYEMELLKQHVMELHNGRSCADISAGTPVENDFPELPPFLDRRKRSDLS